MKIADTSGQDRKLERKPSRKPLYLGISAVIIVVAIIAVWPSVNQWQSAQVSVPIERLRLAKVKQGDLVRDLSIEGRVVAAISPKLYSSAQGTITFHVAAGDAVNKGQVLATIDSPDLASEDEQQRAVLDELSTELARQKIQAKKQMLEDQKAIDMAKVALTAADREKRRADKAYAAHTISNIDFEKAQDDLHNAKLVHQHAVQDAALNKESLIFEIESKTHQLTRQQLKVEELKRQVEQLSMRSPVSGIVGNLAVEQKNQVAKNQSILSVVDLSEFELDVLIPESYADDLAIGMEALVNVSNNSYPALLVNISPEIENNQVTGRVRFASPESQPQGLRQNQRLTTRILLENKSNVLLIQRGQFLEAGAGRVAYVVEGNIARRVPIQTGARSMAAVEIVSGLSVDDEIIISGTDLFNGAQTILITQ